MCSNAHAFVRDLACIHPMNLAGLMARSVVVLASTSGLDEDHPIFMPLRAVRTPDELARFDWEKLTSNLQLQAWLHVQACRRAVRALRLLIDRALLHRQLYLSKSAMTLRLQGQCVLPSCVKPLELLELWYEFDQCMCEADRALHAGRKVLDQFQSQALQGMPYRVLRSLLDQARMCYESYRRELARADELADYVDWYLEEKERTLTPETISQPSPYAA